MNHLQCIQIIFFMVYYFPVFPAEVSVSERLKKIQLSLKL